MTDWQHVLFGSAPAARRPSPRGPSPPRPHGTGWETGLDPTLVAKAQQLTALAAQEGIALAITAGHRSREDQARLYAQGRTSPGGIVTYAKPGQSRHESGRAIDVVPLKDGKPDWQSPHWSRLGALGHQLGLEWGGTWKKLTDRPHFQLPAGSSAPPARGPAPARDGGAVLFAAPAPGGSDPSAIPGLEHVTPTFRTKVQQVARRLRMDPQHLLTVMSFETGGTFDPAVRNQAGSGATGLIQFLPATATSLGTSTAALAGMTPEQQLDYVERYLKPYAGRMRTQQDAYLAVLNPSAIGKPASHVLFTQGTPQYELNKALDKEGKGTVTVGDTVASVGRHLQAPGAPAVSAPREWGQELFATQAPSPHALPVPPPEEPASLSRDWGAALFATPTTDAQAPVRPVREGAIRQAPGQGEAARDWGAVLFGPPTPAQPAQVSTREWGAELFG